VLAAGTLPGHAFDMATPPSPGRGPSLRTIPDGDTRERMVCPDCGFIAYENPKVVVGSVVVSGDRFLLCRRAIEPRRGYWTLPAGYLEVNESTMAGAAREAFEEARARIAIEGLLAVYDIPRISQVQVIYRARLAEPAFEAGPESLEVQLFAWDEIPWDALAFPSVHWSLHHFKNWQETGDERTHGAPEAASPARPQGL
jgi:ADP-ribose pyrophosphatase YjhB (NUDIX family)